MEADTEKVEVSVPERRSQSDGVPGRHKVGIAEILR